MKINLRSPKLIIGILITVFFGVSLIFRVVFPYDHVFGGELIKFTSIDAYYQMRIVDNMALNFPRLTDFDPYLIYPGGGDFGKIHFFNWFMAAVVWIIGLGSPTQHTVDMVGVYFPPVLAALTVIPVYFIGKTLFHRWAGVLAAGLVAILPGEFIGRSILGFADTPAIETLFTATTMAFLIMAIKMGLERGLSFNHLRQGDKTVIIRPLIFSVLGGAFLGLYLITWQGGMLFAFIITIYLIIQFIINHLRHKPSEHLAIIGFVFFLIALIIFLPVSMFRDLNLAMVAAMLIPLVFISLSRLMAGKNIKPYYYPLSLVGLGAIFLIALQLIAPVVLDSALLKFKMIFAPGGATGATTQEMQPFLSPQGSFSTLVAWGNYTTSFFLLPGIAIPGFALITFSILIYLANKQPGTKQEWWHGAAWTVGILAVIMALIVLVTVQSYFALIPLIILVYLFFRQRSNEKHWLLFLVWTLVILVATLVQRRFAYYLVVNIAVLSAFLSWQLIWLAGLKKVTAMREAPQDTGTKKKGKESPGWTMHHVNVILAIIVVIILVFSFNIVKAKDVASVARYAPSDAWQESLLWMKDNTPDPLGDPDAYYKLYQSPSQGGFQYPETAYAVTAWWDYGYWISRTAHRLPNTNPSQAAIPITKVANLFLAEEESETHEIMNELGSSYIIADYAFALTKFWAMATWAERDPLGYFDIYYIPYEGNRIIGKPLFYPEYYRSLYVRLYNFNGEAVTAEKPWVITYEDIVDDKGQRFKVVIDRTKFSSYQEAVEYLESEGTAKRRIVGSNPFSSPIPLEPLKNFRMVYSSEHLTVHRDYGLEQVLKEDFMPLSEVKIFQYIR